MPVSETQTLHPDVERYVPDEIVSLRQLEVLYGALWESRNRTESSLDGTYAIFQTPDELTDFVATDESDESRRLVLLYVDVTGPAPMLTDVSVRPLTEEYVPLLGYSRYPWGRAIDHSLTQRGGKSGSTAADVARYARECLLQWTDGLDSEPSVGEVIDEHPDGWLIDVLRFIGGEKGLYDELEDAFEGQFETEPRTVVSVATRVSPEQLNVQPTSDRDWYLPGELDVFNAAMRARKVEKLSTKHNSQSRGYGTELVTNQEHELVGTADDPLRLYSTRQVDTFANLERDSSWRSHPLGVESALLLQSATHYLDVCRWTRDGLHTYLLPYPTTTSPKALSFVTQVLESLDRDGGHPVQSIETVATNRETEIPDELRFYRLTINNDQGDISVYRELSDIDLDILAPLINAHQAQFDGWLFSDVGFATVADWLLLSPASRIDVSASVLDGRYAAISVPVETQNNRASLDNPVDELTDILLTRESINTSWLFSRYLEKLRRIREDDSDSRLSHYHVMSQVSQLLAFAETGYLEWPCSSQNQSAELPATSSPVDIHEHRVRAFVHRLIDEPNSPLASAVQFGVALGQTSALQRRHGRQLTLDEQYPVEIFSVQSRDAVESYMQEYAMSGDTLRHELLRNTLDNQTHFTPNEFRHQPAAMRFYMAVGSTFGRLAYSRATTLADD